jgi:tetratricopeptide (TPR) repeat protein
VDSGTEKRKAAGQAVKYNSHVMDREIICPKCGARERYELTPQANLRLMVPTASLESFAAIFRGDKGEPKFKPHPNVHYFESLIFGRPMHPLEGLDKYRELIAANPKDVALRMRMGNILRTLHRYPQALEAFRQGYQLGTDDPEYVLTRAMAEHDFGDREIAKGLYEETVTLASKQLMGNPYMITLVQTAHQGLKSLKRGKGSPWQPDVVSGGSKPSQPSLPFGLPKKQSKAKSKKKKNKRKK